MENNRLSLLLAMLQEGAPDAFLLFALAKEYEGLNQPNEALSYYLQLKSSHPDYIGLYYHLGGLYVKMQQKDAAMEVYNEGIERAQRLSDFHAKAELMNARQNLEFDL